MTDNKTTSMGGRAFRYKVAPLVVGAFDLGGVLYHAKYLELLELAREAFLVAHGCSYRVMMDLGYHIVIVEAHQSFHASLRYGQLATIDTWASEIRRSTFVLQYEMHVWRDEPASEASGHTPDPSGASAPAPACQRIHHAMTRLACVQATGADAPAYRPARIPQPLTCALEKIFAEGY